MTQSLLGSGPVVATVSAWAVLNHLGSKRYTEISEKMIQTKAELIDGIKNINGIPTWETDNVSLIIISDIFEIQQLTIGMHSLG